MKEVLERAEKFYMEFGDSSQGRTPSEILEDLQQYHDDLLLEIGRGGRPIDSDNLDYLKTAYQLIVDIQAELEEDESMSELEVYRQAERLMIQQVDRDMEDVMFYENEGSEDSLFEMEVAGKSLDYHAKKLEEIQEYIAKHE